MFRQVLRLAVLVSTFLLFSFHSQGALAANSALSKEAVNALCEAATKLKRVAPYTDSMLDAAGKAFGQMENNLFIIRTERDSGNNGSNEEDCADPDGVLQNLIKKQKRLRGELKEIRKSALNASAYAARAAGRIEEFAMAFIQTYNSGHNHCVTHTDGNPATQVHLDKCFSKELSGAGSVTGIGEKWLPDVATMWDDPEVKEVDPKTALGEITFDKLGTHTAIKGGSSSTNCALTKAASSSGLLGSTGLANSFAWGGGIFVLGHSFGGDLSSNFAGGEGPEVGGKSLSSNARWTAAPAEQVLHLKKAVDAFTKFKDSAESLIRDADETKRQLSKCFGGEILEKSNITQGGITDFALSQTRALRAALGELTRQRENLGHNPKENGSKGQTNSHGEAGSLPLKSETSYAQTPKYKYLHLLQSFSFCFAIF